MYGITFYVYYCCLCYCERLRSPERGTQASDCCERKGRGEAERVAEVARVEALRVAEKISEVDAITQKRLQDISDRLDAIHEEIDSLNGDPSGTSATKANSESDRMDEGHPC